MVIQSAKHSRAKKHDPRKKIANNKNWWKILWALWTFFKTRFGQEKRGKKRKKTLNVFFLRANPVPKSCQIGTGGTFKGQSAPSWKGGKEFLEREKSLGKIWKKYIGLRKISWFFKEIFQLKNCAQPCTRCQSTNPHPKRGPMNYWGFFISPTLSQIQWGRGPSWEGGITAGPTNLPALKPSNPLYPWLYGWPEEERDGCKHPMIYVCWFWKIKENRWFWLKKSWFSLKLILKEKTPQKCKKRLPTANTFPSPLPKIRGKWSDTHHLPVTPVCPRLTFFLTSIRK